MRPIHCSTFLLLCFFIIGCKDNSNNSSISEDNYKAPKDALFQKVASEESGIEFENILVEDENLNYYNYTYLYNGSGVATLDFNNDGLLDIFFVGACSPNKLYLNKGNMKFEDVSAKAGIEGPSTLKTGVAIHDVNEDGWPDIYVCHSGLGKPEELTNALYINQKDGTFAEEAKIRGLDDRTNTNHAIFFDYDNDNDLDLFLLNHPISFKRINNMQLRRQADGNITRYGMPTNPQEGDRLYRNEGEGNFSDVSKEAGVWGRAYGLSVTSMDINEDGWMDLYVGNDFVEPDFLYINQKNGTFKNEIDKYFPHTTINTMGADAADINNDGNVDFISLDMLPEDHYRQQTLMTSMRYDRYKSLEQHDYGSQIMHNMLFLKGPDGRMRDVGNLSGIDATDWSWSPLIVDFDNDGMNDIFITNGYRRDLTDLDYMTYYDELVGRGEKPEDNIEELLAIVPSTPIPNYMYHNQGDLKFVNKAKEWGLGEKTFSNGAIHADLDNDGDEDLVVNNFDMLASLYENTSDQSGNNWLQVKLDGPSGNPYGVGAKISLHTQEKTTHKYVQAIKGFMSYSTHIMSFGLDGIDRISEIRITWPDGKKQVFKSPDINSRITIQYENDELITEQPEDFHESKVPSYFGDEIDLLNYVHKENDFVDVKREPLIPRCFSREGPVTEVLDFNKDGLDDLLIGGAKGQASQLLVQGPNGTFKEVAKQIWEADMNFEDIAFEVADFNGDNWPDIYVGSGGNEFLDGSLSYQDRLYLNQNGKDLIRTALPEMPSSTGTVSSGDFDMDGDIDLFVGGYVTPNSYPLPQRSYILINTDGVFKDATKDWSDQLPLIGMCSSSLVHDFNQDGRPDLMIAGEWMSIIWLPNLGNKFGEPNVIENTSGWWMNIHLADIDNDGDQDVVAGNLGLNTKWTASPEQPMEIYGKDFDNNGKFDALITHYVMGEKVVAARRSVLMGQMPSLRPEYVKFSKYAKATIDELVDIDQEDVYHRSVTQLASIRLENQGNGKFVVHELPIEAQIAPVYAINTIDLDKDGTLEVLAGGNDFHLEIETARADGNTFFLLDQKNKDAWDWTPLDGKLNVFNKALRDIDFIEVQGKRVLVLSFNDDKLRFFPISEEQAIQ